MRVTFWNKGTQVELSLERTALTLTLPEAVPAVRLGILNTKPAFATLELQAVVVLVTAVVVLVQSAVPVGLGATALLPAYTREVLHAGPDVFGYLRAAPGIGAGAMALWLAFRPILRHVGVTMFAGVAAFGMATVVLGLTHLFWVALIALVILGMGDMISVFVRSSTMIFGAAAVSFPGAAGATASSLSSFSASSAASAWSTGIV